jgi:hypothetical protein
MDICTGGTAARMTRQRNMLNVAQHSGCESRSLRSNTDLHNPYPDRNLVVFQSLSKQILVSCLTLWHARFLLHSFHFITHEMTYH